MVQSEPTFSNGAGEEQLKMDSGRASAEEQLKEGAFSVVWKADGGKTDAAESVMSRTLGLLVSLL